MKEKGKIVLVFGTFDRLHPGHINFFEQAKVLGDHLIVGVAHDTTVWRLKNKRPSQTQAKRIEEVSKIDIVDEVFSNDEEIGEFNSVQATEPAIIALGYDQERLGNALRKWAAKYDQDIKIVVLQPFEPDKYKTSILNQ